MAGALIATLASAVAKAIDYVIDLADLTGARQTATNNSSCTFTLQANGTWKLGIAQTGTWCTDASKVGLYEATATHVSGVNVVGAGGWFNLATSKGWTVSASGYNVSLTSVFDVAIRRVGTTASLSYNRVTMSATTGDGSGPGGPTV